MYITSLYSTVNYRWTYYDMLYTCWIYVGMWPFPEYLLTFSVFKQYKKRIYKYFC